MARNKNRPSPVLPSGPVAASSTPTSDAATALSTSPTPAVTPLSATLPQTATNVIRPESFWHTGLGYFLARLFRVFSSLQLALCMMTLFTGSLIIGTIVESWYSAEIAGHTVYHTWWFALLLTVLGVNIVCAALKKIDPAKLRARRWPWKKYQTGFLVTHVGLITLVFGGLLTTLFGIEGQMVMIDTPDKELQNELGLTQDTNTIHLFNEHQFDIFKVADPESSAKTARLAEMLRKGHDVPDDLKDQLKGQWTYRYNPGSFSWYDDPEKGYQLELPWGLRILNAIAAPSPGLARSLDSNTQMRVTNYYPHTEYWPYAAAGKGDEKPFTAVQLRLSSPMFGSESVNRWLTTRIEDLGGRAPLIDFLLYTAKDAVLVPEFLSPPANADIGKDGQLVLYIDGVPRPVRVNLDGDKGGKPIKIEGTDLELTILKVGNLLEELARERKEEVDPKKLAKYPMVRFRLTRGEVSGEYMMSARLPNMAPFQSGGKDVAGFSAWYHYPDFRWGEDPEAVKGCIQLLAAPDDKLYCRVYGGEGLREQGFEVNTADSTAVYDLPFKEPMKMQFRLGAYLPKAVNKRNFMPRNMRPGIEPSETYQPAVRGQLQIGNQVKDFWVRMGLGPAEVVSGTDLYLIRYRPARETTDFTVSLRKASATKYAGTDRDATFQSDIVIKDKGQTNGLETSVYMNHTVDHGRYRLFQANFEPMRDNQMRPIKDGDRPVNKSGLATAYDPGRWFKYSGTAIVVLGICIMFWMRAYFFKPTGKRSAEEEKLANNSL